MAKKEKPSHKRCNICENIKPIDEFDKSHNSYQPFCKPCRKIVNKQYYETHKEKQKAYQKQYYEEHKEKIKAHQKK